MAAAGGEVLGADRAVILAMVTRFWQFISGPITLLLMTTFFNGPERGYYYTFNNLLTLQVFFELGLHIVIVSVASHEWAHLNLNADGQIFGNQDALQRLVSLGRSSLKWYLAAGILFVSVCGPVGAMFLARGSLPSEHWLAAWISLVVITGCSLALQPLIALLEGCNQVAAVNQYRVRQAVFGSLVVWAAIVGHLNLWAIVGSQFVRLCFDIWLVAVRFRPFFRPFQLPLSGQAINWVQEVWPMQWRIALQGLATWWASQLMIPVIFEFHGDVEAGRFGMSWSILTTLQGAAFAWIETRRPRFGQLVAQGAFDELDAQFIRYGTISLLLLATSVGAFWGGTVLVNHLDFSLASKLAAALLSPLPTGLLALGVVLFHIPNCQSVYVRAHRTEPFLIPSLMLCATIGVLVTWLGQNYASEGAAAGWLLATAGIQLPTWTWMWIRFRKQWRDKPPITPASSR